MSKDKDPLAEKIWTTQPQVVGSDIMSFSGTRKAPAPESDKLGGGGEAPAQASDTSGWARKLKPVKRGAQDARVSPEESARDRRADLPSRSTGFAEKAQDRKELNFNDGDSRGGRGGRF